MRILTKNDTEEGTEYVTLDDYRELESSLPLSTNRTRGQAKEMLGEVLRHQVGLASHGCVEVTNAINVIDTLIGDKEILAAENQRLLELLGRAMTYGVNGARLYSASEALRTGKEMLEALSNARIDVSSLR